MLPKEIKTGKGLGNNSGGEYSMIEKRGIKATA